MANSRSSIWWILSVAVLALLAGACGPSGKEVAMAKQARYRGDKLALFGAVKQATENKYKLQKSDETTLGLQTIARWYNPEGQAVSANMGDVRDVPDQSLNISLIVELLPEGENYVVAIKPVMLRYHRGRPNPDMLDPQDPSIPGWARGKVDQLHFDIYEALKSYEVKTLASPMPAGETAPAAPEAPAAPADPSGAPAEPAPAP